MGKNQPTLSVLAEILAGIGAMDPSSVELKPVPKCPHYKAFGVADMHARQVVGYQKKLEAELDEVTRTYAKKSMHGMVDVIFGTDKDIEEATARATDKARAKYEARSADLALRIDILERLTYLELVRQFPEIGDAKVDGFTIDEGWVVGWADHSEIIPDLMDQVEKIFGQFAERRSRGHAHSHGPRPHTADHAPASDTHEHHREPAAANGH